MAIYLPSTTDEEQVMLDELTPREIVAELDKYVVGQHEAKALELRDRRSEGLSLDHVPRGVIDSRLGDPDRLCANGGTRPVQGVHGDAKALPLLTDAVRERDPDVVEDHLAGR